MSDLTIPNYRSTAHSPPSVAVVGLTTFRDRLFVATSNAVYELVDEVLVPLKFQEIPPEES